MIFIIPNTRNKFHPYTRLTWFQIHAFLNTLQPTIFNTQMLLVAEIEMRIQIIPFIDPHDLRSVEIGYAHHAWETGAQELEVAREYAGFGLVANGHPCIRNG